MRLSTRSSVDLPQPDGPMKAVTLLCVERHVDVLQRAVVAVVEVEIADRDLLVEASALSIGACVTGRDGERGRCS